MSLGLTRTKPVDDILAQGGDDDGTEGPGRLKKQLGVFDLIGFGIGIVIGAGIFTLTGVEAKAHAGPAIVLSFAFAGLASFLAALCYSELASSVPTAGSAYTYAYATMGEIFAWIVGWDLVLEFALGAASVARAWSGYLGNLFDLPTRWFAEDGSTVNVGAVALTLVLGLVAYVGVRQSARVTGVLVSIKVAICIFIVVVGLFYVKGSNITPFIPASKQSSGDAGVKQTVVEAVFGLDPAVYGIGGVLTAMAIVFFAFTGFEAVANVSEETRKPQRDLPLGLLGTLGIALALYIGVSFVLTGMVEYDKIDDDAAIASAFKSVGAGWAATLVDVAAVAGLTTVVLVDIVAMGRIGFAMARDGLLPRAAGVVHPKFGTPHRVTVVVTVLVAVLAGFVPLATLVNLVSIGTLFAFVLVSLAVPLLRRSDPGLERTFKVPFSPVVPLLSALACIYLMLNLTLETWIRFAVWMAIGLAFYAFYGRRKARLAAGVASS
ncbi:APA family basic amino acid/polyamine antiporter [Motilibacter peucedani]|uniref:APA family basic amino acid/polyamine antiporter n=1 Tax=Motilibacter peucedani TaxID=598650 RepID=A0A420XTE7_9ACTN|nr:amino acid permease [Motilibacter peucedani]RKS80106.1 APA family basic amino acid/polyamine antiporter [Motilibacter peucedani]